MNHSLILLLLQQQQQQKQLLSLKLLLQKTISKKQFATTVPGNRTQQQQQQQHQRSPLLLLPKCSIISSSNSFSSSRSYLRQLQMQQQRHISTLINYNHKKNNNNNNNNSFKNRITNFTTINNNNYAYSRTTIHSLQRLVVTTENNYCLKTYNNDNKNHNDSNFFFFSSQSKSQSKNNDNNNATTSTHTATQSLSQSTMQKQTTKNKNIFKTINYKNINNAITNKLTENEIRIRTKQILSNYSSNITTNTYTNTQPSTNTTAALEEEKETNLDVSADDLCSMIQWWRDLSTDLNEQQLLLYNNSNNKEEISKTNATTVKEQNQQQQLLLQQRYELQDQSIYAFNVSLFLLSHVMVEIENSISNTVCKSTDNSITTSSTTVTTKLENYNDNTRSISSISSSSSSSRSDNYNMNFLLQQKILKNPLYRYWMHELRYKHELRASLQAYAALYTIEDIRSRFIYNTNNTIYSNYNTTTTTTTTTASNERLQSSSARLTSLQEYTNTLHHLSSPYELYNYLSNTIFERPILDSNAYFTFMNNSISHSSSSININNRTTSIHTDNNSNGHNSNNNVSTGLLQVVLSGQRIVPGVETIVHDSLFLREIMLALKTHLYGIYYRTSMSLISDMQQEQQQQQQQHQRSYSNINNRNRDDEPVLSKNEKLQQFQMYACEFSEAMIQRYLTTNQPKFSNNDKNNNNNKNNTSIWKLLRSKKNEDLVGLIFVSISCSSHGNAFATINNIYSSLHKLYRSVNSPVPTIVFHTYLRSLVMSSKSIDDLDFIRTVLLESIVQYYDKNFDDVSAAKPNQTSCAIALSGYLLAQQINLTSTFTTADKYNHSQKYFPPQYVNGQRVQYPMNYIICNTINDTKNAIELNHVLKEKSFFLLKDIHTIVQYMENNMHINNNNNTINNANSNSEENNLSTSTTIPTQTQTQTDLQAEQYTTTTATGNGTTMNSLIYPIEIINLLHYIIDTTSDDVFYNIKNTYVNSDISLVYQKGVEQQRKLKASMKEFLNSLLEQQQQYNDDNTNNDDNTSKYDNENDDD